MQLTGSQTEIICNLDMSLAIGSSRPFAEDCLSIINDSI